MPTSSVTGGYSSRCRPTTIKETNLQRTRIFRALFTSPQSRGSRERRERSQVTAVSPGIEGGSSRGRQLVHHESSQAARRTKLEYAPEMEQPTDWSLTYNLICFGGPSTPVLQSLRGTGEFPAERMFEYTSPELRSVYEDDVSSLAKLPALVVAEAHPGGAPETPAFLTRLTDIYSTGYKIRFRFRHQSQQFSSEEVFGPEAPDLGIGPGEHSRTHWAIKEGDLLGGLVRLFAERAKRDRPRLFHTDWPLQPLGHVAVMMPFAPEYDDVYSAIRDACTSHSLEAKRVDEIFGPNQVMDDVFTTIVQSRFVISDLTRRNPNVLYETGLAHARNCEVVMIVQDAEDVPFDLRHLRFVKYVRDSEGLQRLRDNLKDSIGAVLGT